MPSRLAAIALGGACGAVARYLLTVWVTRLSAGSAFPYGTLTVNVLGSFLIGVVLSLGSGAERLVLTPTARALLAIGFLGGFTTFSTFSYETLDALRHGDIRLALLNAGISVVLTVAACGLGLSLGTRL